MTDKMIAKLETLGFNRWTKGNMDRMYINASDLGLECTYYNTGNIRSAVFNGEEISNSEGYRLKAAKTYIDLATGEVHGTNDKLAKAAQELLDDAIAEETEEETEAEETEENEMRTLVKVENGMVDYKDAEFYMDDEIREDLHAEMAPCTEQEFFDAYIKKHAEKFDGEDFVKAHCMVVEDGEV